MPGHPDGQNYAIWRAPYFTSNPAIHVDSTHPFHAEGQLTNYASLILNILAFFTAGITVTVHWWVDSTKTQQLAQDSWILPVGVVLSVITPALTNFASVDITTTDPAGGLVSAGIQPTSTPASNRDYQTSNNVVSNFARSITAGATVVQLLPYISPGKGHFFFQDVNASTKLTFEIGITDITGLLIGGLALFPAPVTQVQGVVNLPDRPCCIEIVNLDGAAAHTAGYLFHGIGR